MKKIYCVSIILIMWLMSGCYANSKNDLYYALENDLNYTYSIEYRDDENIIQKEYLYNDTDIQIKTPTNDLKSVTLCDSLLDSKCIIEKLNDGTTLLTESSSVEFTQLRNEYFKEVHLKTLISNEFGFNGITYSLNESKVNEVCNSFFNHTFDGNFKTFDVTLENGNVGKIDVTYLNGDNEESITINFFAFGLTVVEIPEVNQKVVTNINPSIKLTKALVGTTLSEALDSVFLYVYYEDGSMDIYDIVDFDYSSQTYDSSSEGTYEVKIKALGMETIVNVELLDADYLIPNNIETLQDYAQRKQLSYGLPSTGNSKALVIPVEFTDYEAHENTKINLEKAFFGTEEDTGWESLTSYYFESSYGKLNIQGTVLDVFNTGYTTDYYNKKYELGQNADYLIIKSALAYYDSKINYDEYDSNKDGYIDALYIVYTAPIDYRNSSSMWWAYTYEYFTNDYEFYDNVEADFYCFLGYDFLFEKPASNKHIKLNCETIIHETGHLLGLDDYYDYDESVGPSGGLGGGDMMDHNVGDHNPFSKILMGWVKPYVVTNSCTLNISSFRTEGQCILLADKFISIYDEYYLIDYYSPSGLNALEAGNDGLFSISGIRIFHINAKLNTLNATNAINMFEYNNSYTEHKLISFVEVGGNYSVENISLSKNHDLLGFSKKAKISSWHSASDAVYWIKPTLTASSTVSVSITKE